VKVVKVRENKRGHLVAARVRARCDPRGVVPVGEPVIWFEIPFDDGQALREFARACGHEEAARPGGDLDGGILVGRRPMVMLASDPAPRGRSRVLISGATAWARAL
jgi:hypothetical protein